MNKELTFGEAIDALKLSLDKKATRNGWLNNDRYIEIDKGFFNFNASAEQAGDMGTFLQIDENPKLCSVFGIKPNLFIDSDVKETILPSIIHVLKNRNVSSSYIATHEDILANDWRII